MTASPPNAETEITPTGVRDGDPDVLAALCTARGPSVLAYCEVLCPPRDVTRAASEAFARFRAAVAAAHDVSDLEPEMLLIGATRHAAAELTPPPAPPSSPARVLLGRGRSTTAHASIPLLLAGRADGALTASDASRLEAHLQSCPDCRRTALAFERAERAYANPQTRTLDGPNTLAILNALAAAAPIRTPEPAPRAPHFEQKLPPLPAQAPAPAAAGEQPPAQRARRPRPKRHDTALPRARPETGVTLVAHAREHGRLVTFGLPLAVIVATVLAALAASGILGGDRGTPPRNAPATPVAVSASTP